MVEDSVPLSYEGYNFWEFTQKADSVIMDCLAPEEVDGEEMQVLRGTRYVTSDDHSELDYGEVEKQLEIYLAAGTSSLSLEGLREGAVDSSFVIWPWDEIPGDLVPLDLIRFGQMEWGQDLVEFSSEPGSMYPWKDLDYDFLTDSVISYRLVTSVVANDEIHYASDPQFGSGLANELFGAMADTVYANCKWVRQSLMIELHLTNQRDPNTTPGQPSIPDQFQPERVLQAPARMDLRFYLLAPDLGPIRVVSVQDLDFTLSRQLDPWQFQYDFKEVDYLRGWTVNP
jgi:hypothetical protein